MLVRSRAYSGISSPESVLNNCCFSLSGGKLGRGALICHPLSVEIRGVMSAIISFDRVCESKTDMQIHTTYAYTQVSLTYGKSRSHSCRRDNIVGVECVCVCVCAFSPVMLAVPFL